MSGIYIHIPFASKRVITVTFISTSMKRKEEMVLALAKEIQMRKTNFKTTQ
jgi:oxygen-independent coproporphyrinogen-3 oxidase